MRDSIRIIIGIVWYLWLINGTVGCGTRLTVSSNADEFKTSSGKKPVPDFDSGYQNKKEKSELMMNIQNRMLSVALQFIIDLKLETGGLDFTCLLNESATYADQLDCQKYYVCDANNTRNFTTKHCGGDEGFDNATLSCVPKASVELCKLAKLVPDFTCNSTGLHSYKEDCSKFIVCTKEKIAFVSSCNAGDSFDKSLLICLPNMQAIC